jgi:hypothetical protein
LNFPKYISKRPNLMVWLTYEFSWFIHE